MAAWWCMWLVLVWAGVSVGAGGQEWAECEPAVCGEVVKQAQGLARLKLLRNYVVQTTELLESMVGSLEDEVVRAGQSLTQFIGGECVAAHPFLHQVTQEDSGEANLPRLEILDGSDDDYFQSSTSTTHGSTTHGSTTHGSTTHGSTTHGSTTHHGGGSEADGETQHHRQESTSESHITLGSLDDVVTQDLEMTSSSSHSLTNKFDQITTSHSQDRTGENRGFRQGSYVAPSSPPWRPAGAGTGGSGYGYGGADLPGREVGQSGQGNSHGRGRDSPNFHISSRPGSKRINVWNKGVNRGPGFGSRPGQSGSLLVNTGTSDRSGAAAAGACKGVEQGHPFWVPGLDFWCASNCRLGNCPKDRCVC